MRAELRALALTMSLTGCGAPPDAPVASPAPLTVEFAGCEAVLRGPVCTLAPQPTALRLWLAAEPDHTLVVEVDGAPLPAEAHPLAGGVQLQVTIPGGSSELVVRDTSIAAAWSLALQPSLRVPALRLAWFLLRRDEPVAAAALAAAIEPLLTPLARIEAMTIRRKAAYRRSMVADDPTVRDAALAESARLAEQIVTQAGALGLVSAQSESALASAWFALDQGDLLSARTWLESQESAALDDPHARAAAPYYAGLLAHAAGDLREALHLLAEAEVRTRRLGLVTEAQSADIDYTVLLAELGRNDEVLARARRPAPMLDPCMRAHWFNNAGWSLLLLAEAGHESDDPAQPLETALALSEADGACPCPPLVETVRINLAFVALIRGDPEEARPLLDILHSEEPLGDVATWLPELDGRVALQEGRPIADAELMAREPPDGGDAELGARWSSALRRGQALARRGLLAAAVDAYTEAESLLGRMVQTVGLDQGRELLLAGKQRSARALVDLLVDRDQPEAALCAARLARLRGLRALDRAARLTALGPDGRARWDQAIAEYQRSRQRAAKLQRDAWGHVGAGAEHHRQLRQTAEDSATRALDQAYAALGDHAAPRCVDLPAPGPGELLLFIFATDIDWIAFAVDTTGVTATRLPALDSRDLAAASRALLDPLAERLAAATQLRVSTSGFAWDIPVHALPWRGDIVLSALPVSYALDLPGPRASATAGREALVIADPTGNLAHAREEARAVASTLGAQGWHVARLEQREATGVAVSAALARADLLHYAGHGRRDGLSGWGSVLALADDDTLAIHDVLALSRVPGTVVLSGCETAASDVAALAGGMNLARAFLIAGSTAVIAAGDVIDDDFAADLSARLHEGLAPGEVVDAPARLRHALLELRRTRPGSQEWAKFRALVP